MARALKWLLLGLAALLLALAAAFVAAQRWVGSADFRARVEREGGAALGLPLRLQSIDVTLWPLPAVTLQGIEVAVKPAITARSVDVRPAWLSLLRGEPRIATLRVQDAVLSQAALDALLASDKANPKGKKAAPAPQAGLLPRWLPAQTVLQGLVWTNAKGATWTLDARIQMDADGLPEALSASVLKGRMSGARLGLRRTADGLAQAEGWPTWALDLQLAGGSVKGKIAAAMPGLARAVQSSTAQGASTNAPPAKTASGKDEAAPWALRGQFETRDVEVSVLSAPARTLSGRLQAETQLQARAASAGALAEALATQTRFNIRGAVLHGIDLAQAVKTVGMSRGGQTALDTLAGQVSTQGAAIQLSNLVASSGLLSATGNVAISPSRALAGRVNVDMVSGVVGVPLQVGGTLDAPSVMLTRGAMVGAALGTVLAPGIGTGAGASLGDKVGEGLKGLFGGKK